MNSQRAKKVNLPNLLSYLGYEPVKVTKGRKEMWYKSPFRDEDTPSFHTSYLGGKWIWKDFGDSGGNVIDFVMRHQNIQFKEALAFLRNIYQKDFFESSKSSIQPVKNQSSLFSFQQQTSSEEKKSDLAFLEAYDIQSIKILSYLESERKIPADLAKHYLKEVKYRNILKDKIFFAFGMKNESGGYEIRSASDQYKFKSALIKRDVSLIIGRAGDSKSVSVFEGMTDFLSLLVLKGTDQLDEDAIIMHSVTTYKRMLQIVGRKGYNTINTYLDNDASGKKYTDKIAAELSDLIVLSQSQIYQSYKDLNEALLARHKPNSFSLLLFNYGERLAFFLKNEIIFYI